MSVNDEVTAGSDSFWEVDQYKRTVKRQEEGHKACNDLIMLIEERAKVEKDYAKSLKAWNKKWLDLIEKGPEYATMEGAIKGMLQEADCLADVHLQKKESLIQDVAGAIKQWRTENYHKGMVGPCKETKQLEDEFRKAQKSWAKKMGKVQKTKKEYHTACKLEKTAQHQENNARGDSGLSPDQIKKIQDKAEKCRREVENTKDKYEHALRELKDANPKYMEDMTEVFNKSQEFEHKRLQFFKEMLFGVHKVLEPASYSQIPTIYADMHSAIDSADSQQDLKWFSNYHGVDMPMYWPAFEEYSPELNTISRKEKKQPAHTEGITMTSIKRSEPNTQPTTNHNTPPASQSEEPKPIVTEQPKRHEENGEIQAEEEEDKTSSSANPFGEDDDDWDNEIINKKGVPIRALYDYAGVEDDEISFKEGDILMKLKERDDQGWCLGKINGQVGLYPDNYCVEITGE